jgi:hypothetical protein
MNNSLDGHIMAKRSGAARKKASARKKNQWQRRRSNELVNSNSKRLLLK